MLRKIKAKLHIGRNSGSRGSGGLQLLDQEADDACLAAIRIQRFWRAYRERALHSRKPSVAAWQRWRKLIDLVYARWMVNRTRPGTVPTRRLEPPATARSCRSLSPLPRSSSDPHGSPRHSRDDLSATLERKFRDLFGIQPIASQTLCAQPPRTPQPSSSLAGPSSARRLSGDDFEILEQLGDGDTGKVFLVRLRGTHQLYAMKVVNKRKAQDENKITRVMIEREILELADHPFVIRLEAAFQNDEYLFLVLEFCGGGDIFSRLQSQPFKFLPEKEAQFYAAEVLLALEYLHMIGYVYRDLKPENILLSHAGHIKLADFDLAARATAQPAQLVRRKRRLKKRKKAARGIVDIQPRDRFNSRVGTVGYAAPEVLKEAGHTSAVDWWTFGVLLHEMLFGRLPFTGSPQQQLLQIMSGSISFPDFPQVSSAARHLVKRLLSPNPKKRLGHKHGAADIREHPFFAGVNWALIRNQRAPWLPPERPVPRSPMLGQALTLFGPSRGPSRLPASLSAPGASARIRATDLRRPVSPSSRRLNPFLDEHIDRLSFKDGVPVPPAGDESSSSTSPSGEEEGSSSEEDAATTSERTEASAAPALSLTPPQQPPARGRPLDPNNPFSSFEFFRPMEAAGGGYADAPPTHAAPLSQRRTGTSF